MGEIFLFFIVNLVTRWKAGEIKCELSSISMTCLKQNILFLESMEKRKTIQRARHPGVYYSSELLPSHLTISRVYFRLYTFTRYEILQTNLIP